MERNIKIIITISKYFDTNLKKDIYKDTILEVSKERAIEICKVGYAKIYCITKG